MTAQQTPNQPKQGSDTETATGIACDWRVSGMDCAACAGKVSRAVARLPGVQAVEVGLMAERLSLRLDESVTPRSRIEDTVRALGYGISARTAAASHPQAAPPASCGCGHDHSHSNGHSHSHSHGHEDADSHGPVHTHDRGHTHGHDDPAAQAPHADQRWWQSGKGRLVIGTAALLLLATVTGQILPESRAWSFALACLIGLWPVARQAWAALRAGEIFTIEGLMTLSALGALVIGAAEEAAVVIFLFAVGELLEGVAANRARAGIHALSALVPQTALIEEDGQSREVPAARLRVGQIVLVPPGSRIPADGIVTEGRSEVDDSPVTGESLPVAKVPGDSVHAGAINAEALLRIRVTTRSEDNTIARIIRLVEEAEASRAPTERFINRFSRSYMPAVVALAVAVAVLPPLAFGAEWQVWIYRGLALLLIGCPCALVISVPAAIAAALSAGARHGLLMKGGAVIEAVAKIERVAFDKTGTLTRGQPAVVAVEAFDTRASAQEDGTQDGAPRILALAAAIEEGSTHPLARAIRAQASAQGLALVQARAIRALPGRGVEATVEGRPLALLNPRAAQALCGLDATAASRIARLEEDGRTVVVLCEAQGQALGLIALGDQPRPEAGRAIGSLHAMGIGTVMLTGDNPRAAQHVAQTLGIAEVRAGMLPEDKLAEIRRLETTNTGGVMMVGDGINDAPALKQARIGLAMGSGTDVALETADAALLRDRIEDVPAMIRLARATMTNIRQDVAIALGLKGLFLITTVAGVTGLWPAILADSGATVLVTLNALRLLRFAPGA